MNAWNYIVLLLYIKLLLNYARMFYFFVNYCTGPSAEMSEMGQMSSLLLAVKKCIKRALKNKLLSKILLTYTKGPVTSLRRKRTNPGYVRLRNSAQVRVLESRRVLHNVYTVQFFMQLVSQHRCETSCTDHCTV